MITPGPLLRDLQDEVYLRLKSEELLADVGIFRDQAGEIDAESINAKLGPLAQGDTGKSGAAVIVLAPRIDRALANNPGPLFDAVVTCQVIVNPLVNDDATNGTLLKADEIALAILHSLHQLKLGGLAGMLLPDSDAIAPAAEFLDQGMDAFNVTLRLATGLEGGDRAGQPSIGGTSAAVTLTSATSGAAIYYTTDGTYPGSGNSDATLYTGAFAVDAGTTVRAAAQKTGLNASDVTARDF